MEQEFNKVTKILNRLNLLQTHHIESFRQESMPDIEMQGREREREFTNLKDAVNQLTQKVEHEKDKKQMEQRLFLCNEIIAELLKQNNKIKEKIKIHMELAGNEIKKMALGKKVLSSYGRSTYQRGLSKVMNISR